MQNSSHVPPVAHIFYRKMLKNALNRLTSQVWTQKHRKGIKDLYQDSKGGSEGPRQGTGGNEPLYILQG